MTEPVNMKKLGGLSYNANLVSSAKKLKNGKFEIVFKSGEKITYPYQKDFVRSDGSSGIAKTGEDIKNLENDLEQVFHCKNLGPVAKFCGLEICLKKSNAQKTHSNYHSVPTKTPR